MPLTGEDVASKALVIFDFDGTLVDSMPGIIRTARSVMHEHGWTDEALGDMRRLVGPPFPAAFTEVYGASPEEAMRITEEYRAIYQNLGYIESYDPEYVVILSGDHLYRIQEAVPA